jgi:hypothetical protein
MPTTRKASTEHKDYSGTPLSRKLGIREGSLVLLVDPPDGFGRELEPLPPGARVLSRAAPRLDVVVVFATEQMDLARGLARHAASIHPAGRLWVAWPKKASKVPTDITFEAAQGMGLDGGLVDNKSASVTDVFQGLQFVYRLKDRPGAR